MDDEVFSARTRSFWMAAFAASVLLSLAALIQTFLTFQALPTGLVGSTWGLLLVSIFLFSFLLALLLLLAAWRRPEAFEHSLHRLAAHPHRTGWAFLLLTLLLFIVFMTALWLRIPGTFLSGLWVRLALFAWVPLTGAIAARSFNQSLSWPAAWTLTALTALVIFQSVGILQWVTNDPFSQGWSEGSFIYYASLVASRRVFGRPLPLSVVYPSRSLLDAVPLLVGRFPIWVFRLWSAILPIGFSLLTGTLLVRRLHLRSAVLRVTLVAAAFLFLMQGAVKYELQVCVILVLALVDHRHFWRSLLILTLASFWAGMSRLNWYPVPAVLAILLYFLERPVSSSRNLLRYLILPVFWFIFGVGMALAGNAFTLLVTHTDLASMLRMGTSHSYWYRLLPNPLYSPGVLFGILGLLLAVWLLIGVSLRRSRAGWHFIRLVGIGAILLVLFAGGMLVSSKIGGGGDLHNVDAYTVAVLITAGYLVFAAYTPESGAPPAPVLPRWIMGMAVVVLAGFIFFQVQPYRAPDPRTQEQALRPMEPLIASASSQGEVLFLSQRQLLIFGKVQGVPLVPEYDQVEVARWIYTGNYPLLDAFQEDLQAQRFSMVVADIQKLTVQDIYHHPFAEENNLWVDGVSKTLLCYYEPALVLPDQNVALYVPVRDPHCTP